MGFLQRVRACAAHAAAPVILGGSLLFPSVIARAVEPRVPGLNELVIYDPGVHERGLPSVQFQTTENGLEVDIPPIVHVHRYYYSGNKEFQGPLITGGPTVVVANHPKSGERLYIDVMLPAGAPVIEYDDETITYAFPDRRVILTFSGNKNEKVQIKYLSGKGVVRALHEKKQVAREHTQTALKQSRLVGSMKELASDGKKVVVGAAAITVTVAATAVETTGKVVRVIPGVALLQSISDQHRERAQHEAIRQTDLRNAATETEFVRTIR